MSLLIPGTNSIKDTGYDVANSAMFSVGSSDNIQRTYGTPTNSKIFGLSWWIKLGKAWDGSGSQDLWGERADGSNRVFHAINADGTFNYFEKNGGSTVLNLQTNRLFRDNSSWYHFLLLGDSTQGTASNRIKLYVNGVQETSFSTETYPSQDYQFRLAINTTKYFGRIGLGGSLSTNYYDGYLAEAVFVDGTVTAHTDYGEFDEDSPTIWKPKDVSGLTFGNNGFYLDFENASSLGADVSGNSNNFTVNNLTSIDQTTDTCTNNFMTLNPLSTDSGVTLSEGNTESDFDGSVGNAKGNIGLTKGRWYWEVKLTNSTSGYPMIGIGSMNESQMQLLTGGSYPGGFTDSYGVYGTNLRLYANGTNEGEQGSSYTTGDIFGIYLDLESSTKTIKWYKNGSSVLSRNITNAGSDYPYTCMDYNGGESSVNVNYNFGNPAYSITSSNTDDNGYGNFEYSPNISSTKYYAVCTKNLAEFG